MPCTDEHLLEHEQPVALGLVVGELERALAQAVSRAHEVVVLLAAIRSNFSPIGLEGLAMVW